MKNMKGSLILYLLALIIVAILLSGCSSKKVDQREEQIIDLVDAGEYGIATLWAEKVFDRESEKEQLEEMIDYINKHKKEIPHPNVDEDLAKAKKVADEYCQLLLTKHDNIININYLGHVSTTNNEFKFSYKVTFNTDLVREGVVTIVKDNNGKFRATGLMF